MSFRKNGPIPSLSQLKLPTRMIVFDTEAYRQPPNNGLEVQSLRLAVARYLQLDKSLNIVSDEWFECRSGEALVSYIEFKARKDKALYIYAHNLKYDLQLSGLLTLLLDRQWKAGLFVLDDPPTFIRLKRGRYSLMLVDTFNYWQTSLKALGDQLGLPKLDMPEDQMTNEDWLAYCRRDVEVLSDYLLAFIRFLLDNDLAPLGLTLASQSFRAYRHRFMPDDIVLHKDQHATELERSAYMGGRVEAFFIGQKDTDWYYKLDINSMYPHIMHDNLMPVELVAYTENIPLDRLERLLKLFYCIAEVELSTDTPIYPYRYEGKLVFPCDTFTTALHQPELLKALANDHIRHVTKIAIYRQANIFSDYIDFFYQLKQSSEAQGDKINRHQAKIIMNSLYGKFGQREVVSRILDNPDGLTYGRLTGYSDSLQARVEVNYLGEQMDVRYQKGESAYSFPAIAGSVTSYARMYLWSLIEQANRENVYYVDTDSLIVNMKGFDNLAELLNSYKLGYLKIENVSDYIEIWGAKDYQFGGSVKHKGVPKPAIEIAPGVWNYQQFPGAKGWLAEGMPVGVTLKDKQKRRKSAYNKGEIQSDGSVLPLRLTGGKR